MKNELMQGASAVKNYRNFNNAYPLNQASFNTVYKIGNEVTLTYVADNPAGSNFCLKATSVNDTSVWYISSVTTQPAASAPTVPSVTCP